MKQNSPSHRAYYGFKIIFCQPVPVIDAYGPERLRQDLHLAAGQLSPLAAGAGTTWYLNGEDNLGLTYERFQSSVNGSIENRHYLSAGGMVFALHTTKTASGGATAPTASLRYMHHDHLGSIAAISNEAGQVVERLAYDPWGKRRYATGLPDSQDQLVGINTDRGYTMHEHLDEVGVIHMNGRIYDPLMGRFMSADPYIQAPGNLQSYDRYSYVMNNPLAYTDPSGYFSLRKFFRSVVRHVVAAVADAMGCAGYCTMAVKAYEGYKAGGPVGLAASFIPGSNDFLTNVAITAAKGCAVASANGGNCGRGAGSELIREQAGGYGPWGQVAGGCLASMNQGGSCRGGAVSAFESYAANHLAKAIGDDLRDYIRSEKYHRSLVAIGPGFLIPFVAPEATALALSWFGRMLVMTAMVDGGRRFIGTLAVNGAEDGTKPEAAPTEIPDTPDGKVTVPKDKFWKDKGIDPHEVKDYDSKRNLGFDKKGNVWSVDRKGSGNPQWEGTIDSLQQK